MNIELIGLNLILIGGIGLIITFTLLGLIQLIKLWVK